AHTCDGDAAQVADRVDGLVPLLDRNATKPAERVAPTGAPLDLRPGLGELLRGDLFEERELRGRLARELHLAARALQSLQMLAQEPCTGEIERLQRSSVDDDPPRSCRRYLSQRCLDRDDVLDAPRAVEAYRQGVPGPCLFEQLASHRAEISIPPCAAAHGTRTLSP